MCVRGRVREHCLVWVSLLPSSGVKGTNYLRKSTNIQGFVRASVTMILNIERSSILSEYL